MCLITTQKVAKVAEKDIIVYKEMNKISDTTCTSGYQGYLYTLGILNKTEIKDVESNNWTCADSVDSKYLNKTYGNDWNKRRPAELRCIGQGYHSFKTLERMDQGVYLDDRYECAIPAGSEYYEDATGLLVSNQIIINKKVQEAK